MFNWNSSIGYLAILAFVFTGIFIIYVIGNAIYNCRELYIYSQIKNDNNSSQSLIDDEQYDDTSSDEPQHTRKHPQLSIIIPPVSP